MNMTALDIGQIVDELADTLQASFLHKVLQTGANELAFEFRKGADRYYLMISASPGNSRIHLISNAPALRLPLSSFAKAIKKALVRGRLQKIEQINSDRLLFLAFNTPAGDRTLALELMGTSGNFYFLDENQNVIAIALQRKSRNRTGAPYILPKPPADGEANDIRKPDYLAPLAHKKAMEQKYETAAYDEKLQSAKAGALAPLKNDVKKTTKRKKSIEKEMASLLEYKQHRMLGDLLQANYASIKKGADSIELSNLYVDPVENIKIRLDPAHSPRANIERYYKRHRKYEKGYPRLESELVTLDKKISELKKQIEAIEQEADIERILEQLPKKPKIAKKESRKKQQPTGPRRFLSSDGHSILVGRSDKENDEITFRIANGRDLWLHARDYPGSHVLVQLPKGAQVSRSTLVDAAMIALHYSKAAKSGKGEVTYAFAKNIRKPKGAPPGKALVNNAKSVMVKIDEKKIKSMKVMK